MKPLTENDQRALRIDHVLTRCIEWGSGSEGLIDLLADARHWCDRHSEAFGDLDRIAHQHYLAELEEERTTP